MGDYSWLESASYSTVVWTTFAVSFVIKDLKSKNKTLSELDVFKKTIINHVTHEFRTPLGAIRSALDVLFDGANQNAAQKMDYLQMISNNTDRLDKFVNQLLDLASIQQSKINLNLEEIDLRSLIEKTIQDHQGLIDKAGIKLNLNLESHQYSCDPDKIYQVISNLLSNAIKAAPQGTIEIKLLKNESNLLILVKDNGRGIPKDHLNKVFLSFYQVTINKSSHLKGSGLGLAIAKGWVEAHGGKIWAESVGEGKGATFKIELPLFNL
jgi:signal transduction histidine kinase